MEAGSVQNVDTDGREGERDQGDDLPDTEGPEREEESDAERSESCSCSAHPCKNTDVSLLRLSVAERYTVRNGNGKFRDTT